MSNITHPLTQACQAMELMAQHDGAVANLHNLKYNTVNMFPTELWCKSRWCSSLPIVTSYMDETSVADHSHPIGSSTIQEPGKLEQIWEWWDHAVHCGVCSFFPLVPHSIVELLSESSSQGAKHATPICCGGWYTFEDIKMTDKQSLQCMSACMTHKSCIDSCIGVQFISDAYRNILQPVESAPLNSGRCVSCSSARGQDSHIQARRLYRTCWENQSVLLSLCIFGPKASWVIWMLSHASNWSSEVSGNPNSKSKFLDVMQYPANIFKEKSTSYSIPNNDVVIQMQTSANYDGNGNSKSNSKLEFETWRILLASSKLGTATWYLYAFQDRDSNVKFKPKLKSTPMIKICSRFEFKFKSQKFESRWTVIRSQPLHRRATGSSQQCCLTVQRPRWSHRTPH